MRKISTRSARITWHTLARALMLLAWCSGAAHAAPDSTPSKASTAGRQGDPVMIILGASYAKDWSIERIGKYRIVNKGIGGEQTHQMLSRLDDDVIRKRPSAVLIWGFINDIFRSSREGVVEKLKQTRENILTMLSRSNQAGIHPILATEITITSPDSISESVLAFIGNLRGKQSYQGYVNGHVMSMNAWLRDIAAERKIMLLDFERLFAGQDGERQRQYAAKDGSHISPEGYAALTKYVNREIALH